MSDTPQTDAAKKIWMELAALSAKLERENAALRADKERLEWLMSGHVISTVFTFNRAAIDAARKENKQ